MNDNIKIFTDNVEPEAVNQVYNLIAQPPFSGAQVRIMPDVHVGMNCVVGFTSTYSDKIIPNVLGSDLGCGMLTVYLGEGDISLKALDDFIRAKIPCGSNYRKEVNGESHVKKLDCFSELRDYDRLYGSLGTLGGGNHFIEVDKDDDGGLYLVIHSGSRNLGLQVAKIYQKLAVHDCKFCADEEKAAATDRLKACGKQAEIPAALTAISAKYAHKTKIPNDFCYLDNDNMAAYIHDLKLCQEFAVMNRRKMADDILKFLHISRAQSFETVHNFIDADNIIRKGAIPAHKGQRVIIPMNMRDGCLIAVGKGNPDWNNSAPHGAGRLLKRSEAKDYFTVDEFKAQMQGIYTTTVGMSTLDESPMVYKPMDEIVRLIEPTVEIEKIVKPIYNFKAGEQ